MRFQFPARRAASKPMAAIGSIALIGSLLAVIGLAVLSIKLDVRAAQAQAAATATPRLTSTPIAGVPITYTVKSGDAFNAIARQFNLTPQQLQALNAITNTSVIRVGQILMVGVSTFTPTPAATNTPASTPTIAPTPTPTTLPTETPTLEPTRAPTDTPISTDQPAATSAPIASTPPTASAPATGIPVDVILVGVLMVLAVIGIVVGFRTQRG